MANVRKIEPTMPVLPTRKKVAAYARVSMETERLHHSLSAQVSYYSDLIQRNPEWEYVGVYADDGITGTQANKRDEFQRLLEDCDAGKIDIVLTKSISRFARNTVDLLETVRHLKELGISVRFEKENIDSLSGDGEVMLTLLASFAQEEIRSLSENEKWSVRKRFEQGIPVGRPRILGYRWEGDTMIVVPEEAVVVRRIYQNFLDGKSRLETERELAAEGITSVYGNRLCDSQLKQILTNISYTGNLLFQKEYIADPISKQRRKNKGELPQYFVENTHEAIIDMETFRYVQDEMARRRALGARANKSLNITCFTGKIKCGYCGKSFMHNVRKNRAKFTTTYTEEDGLYTTWVCGSRTLTVPTGGGKTTAAMAFALTAAVQNCMSRVIYAAPYTSIIDQNADTFEKIFGTENVIEHHSSAEYLFSESPNPAEYRKMLAAENWDAPVIATTTVQLFESLFASKPARCRKLHNLANSVLILDEVQTLPMPYLKPFTAALAELARKYGVIVVLCTATQPALDGVFADLKIDLPINEICPNVPENFETFRRTKIAQHTFDSTESLTAELTALPQVLCIVNRIADAQKIYQALPKDGAYCLTTHLCPAHRKARIKEIRERLKIGLPCRVVSTSLIEAGVDVDFPRVYREEAGLDSVLQAAGRCNREGKRPLDESLVTVFTVQNTTPPPYMRQPAAAMKNISKRMEDITSLAAIRAYFEFYRDLYGKEDLDREKILIAFENEMLPFASVAEKVRVIESCTTPVYIPIDQGEALVERLYRGERSRTLFRKLGQYSVNVYPQQLAALREVGAVQSIDGGALYVLADPRRYDSALGLTLDQTETALFI